MRNNIDLANLNLNQGFKIYGAGDDKGINFNDAVYGLGDVKGDNIDDAIIGTSHASLLNRTQAGESYIILGKNGAVLDIDLAILDEAQRFKILGANLGDRSDDLVSGADDINGDGVDDVTIGAPNTTPSSRSYAGEGYVIYGTLTPIPPAPWWDLFLEIGLPVIGEAALLLIGAGFSWYKYNHCNNYLRNYSPEQTGLINHAPEEPGTWYK